MDKKLNSNKKHSNKELSNKAPKKETKKQYIYFYDGIKYNSLEDIKKAHNYTDRVMKRINIKKIEK